MTYVFQSWRAQTIVLSLLALSCLSAATPPAQSSIEVNLRAPSTLVEGHVYDAELEVRAAHRIPDAYVKLSLPHAFRVVAGHTHFRGTLPAESVFFLRATFRVSAMPSAPIMGRVLVYGESRTPTFGRGKILYCRSSNGSIILSEQPPEAEEDETLAGQTTGLAHAPNDITSLLQQRRRSAAERAVKRETPSGGTYDGWFEGVEPLPENASITGWLEGGTAKAYQFTGHRADRIWLTAESDDLDVRLLLLRSDGTLVAEDDDGAGGTNARIPAQGVFELSSDDTYTIVVLSNRGSQSGSFRLKVENFTHLQPAPSSVLPPADGARPREASGQSAAATALIGKILYNSPTGPVPVRFALVKLYADIPFAVDPELSASQTDINGEFSLSVPQTNLGDNLYLQLYAQDGGFRIATVRDSWLNLDSVYRVESGRFSVPPASTVTFGTWNVAETGQNGVFLLYDAAVEGHLIVTEVLGISPPAVRLVYPTYDFSIFTKPLDFEAHYENREIVLGQGYETSPDVVLHEYGHFVADIGGFSGQGGDHYYPFKQRVNPSLAWGEGWATFFAVAGQSARGRSAKRTYTSNHPRNYQNYDLEDGHDPNVILDSMGGDDNEGSVQFILWDLYDKLQDALPVARTTDTVSLGLKTIFDVARSGAVLYTTTGSVAVFRVDYLEKFYDGLFQQAAVRFEQPGAVRDLFLDQSIRWEVPPAPPTNLRFTLVGISMQLQWQAGSANTSGYVVQQLTPGQTSFATVGTTTSTVYPVPNVVSGARLRVYAWSVNSGRFAAPFFSAFSQELTYAAPPPPPSPTIVLSRIQLSFSFTIGGTLPTSEAVGVSNAGGGTLTWTASSSAGWLLVSPSSGVAPSSISIAVNPAGLAPGVFSGVVTVSSPGVASQTIAVTLRVTAPVPSINAIVNAASFRAGMVPGGLATLFGQKLSPITGVEFPGGATLYKGVKVVVEGQPVPLLAVTNLGGQEQINFQVPFDLGTPALARVEVNNSGNVAAIQNVPVLRAQPGVFEYTPPGSGVRHAAAVKPDGSVAGPANPVSRRDPISIFLTGMGPVLPVLQTGQLGPAYPPAVTYLQPVVGIAGEGVQVLFSGYAPGFLGLYQINIVIPDTAPSGLVNLDVVVDGVPSQTSKIAVR